MTAKKHSVPAWYQRKLWLALQGIGSFILSYVIGSWSIGSGSWWGYLGTLVFLILGFNRLAAAIRAGMEE